MVKVWNNKRRIAVIPVWNNQIDIQPPANWVEQVESRAFFDVDTTNGIDRSLQRYIQVASSGKAYIEGRVFPTVEASDDDTVGAGLNSLPPNHDFNYAMIVLPHSVGPHRGGFAWWDMSPVNGISNVARVAMFSDMTLGMRQNIGVWAMELLHIVTNFGDLYNVSPQLNRFDVMACSCGTHSSAHTKSKMGWLNSGAIQTHALGNTSNYKLHAVSLPQPPPPGRRTAVKVKSKKTSGHFMIECRLRTDVYENSSSVSSGIPSEGVIVYEVQSDTEVYLRTPTALKLGEELKDPDEELTIRVLDSQAGGFTVQVRTKGPNKCKQLADKIDLLKTSIEIETDIFIKKQLISELVKTQKEFRALGCLFQVSQPEVLFKPKNSLVSKDDKSC